MYKFGGVPRVAWPWGFWMFVVYFFLVKNMNDDRNLGAGLFCFGLKLCVSAAQVYLKTPHQHKTPMRGWNSLKKKNKLN